MRIASQKMHIHMISAISSSGKAHFLFKKVREWVKERPKEIALFYLPAYSPEYNSDEYLTMT